MNYNNISTFFYLFQRQRGKTKSAEGQLTPSTSSPDRLKVSKRAESVTSRLYPQYRVKFEYKSPQRVTVSAGVMERHRCWLVFVIICGRRQPLMCQMSFKHHQDKLMSVCNAELSLSFYYISDVGFLFIF